MSFKAAAKAAEMIASNDIRMPSKERAPYEGVDRNTLAISVKRLLKMILWFE